jgi:hypothetical protein
MLGISWRIAYERDKSVTMGISVHVCVCVCVCVNLSKWCEWETNADRIVGMLQLCSTFVLGLCYNESLGCHIITSPTVFNLHKTEFRCPQIKWR